MRCAALAAFALAASACAKSDEQRLAELEAREPFVRALAAFALCEQAPEHSAAALPVLLETVDRVELRLQRIAAAELRKVAPLVAGELVAQLIDDPVMTMERRLSIFDALAHGGSAAAVAVTTALHGRGKEISGELGDLLVEIGAPAVPALAELLALGVEPELRAYAVRILGRIGASARAALPLLRELSSSSDPSLRAEVERALARIESGLSPQPSWPPDLTRGGR